MLILFKALLLSHGALKQFIMLPIRVHVYLQIVGVFFPTLLVRNAGNNFK